MASRSIWESWFHTSIEGRSEQDTGLKQTRTLGGKVDLNQLKTVSSGFCLSGRKRQIENHLARSTLMIYLLSLCKLGLELLLIVCNQLMSANMVLMNVVA